MTNLKKVTALVTLVLAVLRATRFVTTDWLGEWWIVRPAKRWAWKREGSQAWAVDCDHEGWYDEQVLRRSEILDATPVPSPDPANGWRSKLVKGLDCPYCVGFWVGALALFGEATLGRIPGVRVVWRFGAAAFALNYVVGHVSSRIDG